jgi:hypothetical protein
VTQPQLFGLTEYRNSVVYGLGFSDKMKTNLEREDPVYLSALNIQLSSECF